MNSRWQINRIGLVDFWYYDEEEFYFLDGRMLLRGSNGSGKSVTMQSFIPLLLDGNMRPERLDPFGSKARKMKNYLLEENDAREERTGYLYMEFKRMDADSYMTIGIGMRARRNKDLDTWYFCILDGRRVNKDFPLYKDGKAKLSLTKTELKNRIGEGGRVLETQREYMEMVNKQIFGFDTIEEYKEMIELLIQLRTPKLSKDFKPSILNEILGSSLAPLSEDDLRPMSEAIENMDNLKGDLDGLKASFQAANKIKREYEKYNYAVLLSKAKTFIKVEKDYTGMETDKQKIERKLEKDKTQFQEMLEKIEDLKREQSVLEEKKKQLTRSDINELIEEQNQLKRSLDANKRQRADKEQKYSDKKDKQVELEQRCKAEENRSYEYLQEMNEHLDAMETYNELLDHQEFPFMKKDLTTKPEQDYDYQTHQSMVKKLDVQLEEGKRKLEQQEQVRQRYDEVLKELEKCRIVRDGCELNYKQTDNQLTEIKQELIETIHRWNGENQYLTLDNDTMQKIEGYIQAFTIDDDYHEINDTVRDVFYQLENHFKSEQQEVQRELELLEKEIEKTEEELRQWEQKTDPEPECSDEVKECRKHLEENGIPCMPLYKAIDFQEDLPREHANLLEEALLRMNLLNALIIPETYRERAIALGTGCSDYYLFGNDSSVKENLKELLKVDCPNDGELLDRVTNVLESIAISHTLDAGAHTRIHEDGTYQIGILTGTLTGTYQAKYIGVRAREQFRQEKMNELKLLLQAKRTGEEEAKTRLDEINRKLSQLKSEQNHFPNDQDLRVALRSYEDALHQLNRSQEELKQCTEKEESESKKLRAIRNECQELADKVHLSPRLEIFIEALEDSHNYLSAMQDLRIVHNHYQNSFRTQQDLNEQLENIQSDLDELLYDLNRIRSKEKEIMAKLDSITEQLDIKGYEEIKKELEQCIERLQMIPDELEQHYDRRGKLQNDIERTSSDLEKLKEQIIRASTNMLAAEERFQREYHLHYVPLKQVLEDMTAKQCACQCVKEIDVSYDGKVDEYQASLQNIFYENKSSLNDYNLSLDTITFSENESETVAERTDIKAKFQYTSVTFLELITRMEGAIQEKEQILSEKDRELFEDILANTVSRKIRAKIYKSMEWVNQMNEHMGKMHTSSGLTLNLRWKAKRAEHEGQLDTSKLVDLLKHDTEIMREEDFAKLSGHFRSKIAEARKLLDQKENGKSFHMIVKEVLDYRKWFEFTLECKKTGEKKKELTDRVFFTFSGGEKAMSMYVPLFSAVASKYDGARADAPRLISLDEAFAGVDEMNIKDMFRLMVEFEFNFIINSQILYGDYETVPSLAIYQLLRPGNVKYVTVVSYIWNGKQREYVENVGEHVEQ